MTVPHTPKWIEGAPDELKVGMLLILEDGASELVGDFEAGLTVMNEGIIRHTQLVSAHELEWITEKGLTLR